MKLSKIAEIIDGDLKGNSNLEITNLRSIEQAGKDDITFMVGDKEEKVTQAAALILEESSKKKYENIIYVKEPYQAISILLELFYPQEDIFGETDKEMYYIDDSSVLEENVSIGQFTCIAKNCNIGENTQIDPCVTIYNNVKIGKNCKIYSNVVIREKVEIGDNVIIHGGAVIGADGFGFTRLSNGLPCKVPQKGCVKIGNNCEIGANTCIDRSTLDVTILGDYVKLDNLVQIGHNCIIGDGTAVSALTGVSGSVKVGKNVIMGGQVGLADHIEITDGVMIAAKSGISGNIKKRGIFAGTPHMEFKQWKRNQAIFRNLEKYVDRIKELEKKVEVLSKGRNK